ncbi:MAG TPA: response regulator [Candidatus Acidoferrales bacterium]|nr:response regulator [Candidatus Acidoferrales bacterium]
MTDGDAIARLLLVDDDSALAEMYALQLTASGFDVATAHSGPEALRMVGDSRPDLICLDLGLPGMGGLEVLERLRNEPDTASVPVVILTNFSEPEMVERGRSLGAQDYLIKVDTPPAQLAATARRWVRQSDG